MDRYTRHHADRDPWLDNQNEIFSKATLCQHYTAPFNEFYLNKKTQLTYNQTIQTNVYI